MTVKELMAELAGCDPDMEVHYAYPSGDYWRRTLTASIDNVGEDNIIYSDYHRTTKLVEGDSEPEDGERSVIILSNR